MHLWATVVWLMSRIQQSKQALSIIFVKLLKWL